MPAPLTLPRISWGSPSASRRALLVHGLGSSGALMWRLGDALADAGWHATAVDLRGHGDAPRSLDYSVAAYGVDLAVTLPEGGGAWDAVIGHSLGGLTAMMIAARDAKEVGKLMVVDSLPFFGMLFGPSATVATVEPQAAAMQKMLGAKTSAEADERTLQIMSATDAGRAQVKAWTAAANAVVAAQLMYDDMTTDLRPELGAITAPFTMLYPLDTSVMPAELVDGLYKSAFSSAKTIRLQRIDGSRHFIMLDQPEAFARAVDAFLAN